MRLFDCQICRQMLYFENAACLRCGARLGFLPDAMTLSAVEFRDGGLRAFAAPEAALQPCANAEAAGCNWMTAAGGEAFCAACRLNRTIPDLSVPGNPERWQRIERAKRRLVYALLRFPLALASRHETEARGLAFDFLADTPGAPVMTGHADGLVTINIAEADSAERERRRLDLGEPYRTLIGHLRHEVGHYSWDLLVRDRGRLEAARAVFGDERADYAAALQRHYDHGAPADWQAEHVSAYATMHPWEDFAETWTHYLHIVDTLDTAAAFGLAVEPGVTDDPALAAHVGFDPYRADGIDRIVAAWLPVTYAVDSLNRSMGLPDLYPFVLNPGAIAKLGFVHDLIHGSAPSPTAAGTSPAELG